MTIQPDLQLTLSELDKFSPSSAIHPTLKSKVTTLIEDQGPSSFRDLCIRNITLNITFKNFSKLTQDEITKIRTEKGDCTQETYSDFCKDKIPEKVERLLRNAAYIYFSKDPSFTNLNSQYFSKKPIDSWVLGVDYPPPVSSLLFKKDPKQVHSLLQLDCNPNITDYWDYTPLHLAAKSDRAEIASLLINKNANVNVRNNIGNTPLHLAASGKSKGESIQPLIDAGADLDAEDNEGNTPLHLAASGKSKENLIQPFIDAKADLEAKNHKGNTPLHMAVYAPWHIGMAIATTLIEGGANFDTPNYKGNTPLHLAAECGHLGLLRLFIHKKADLNVANNIGHTPLHLAAWRELGEKLIKALIDAGADLHALDVEGRTPLHMAVGGHSDDQVERASILIRAGADPYAKDNKGRTPLMYGKELSNELFKHTKERDLSMVEFLQKAERGLPPVSLGLLGAAATTAVFYISWAAFACSDTLNPARDPSEWSLLNHFNPFYESPQTFEECFAGYFLK